MEQILNTGPVHGVMRVSGGARVCVAELWIVWRICNLTLRSLTTLTHTCSASDA